MYFKHKHLPNSKTYSVLVKPKIADFLLQIHRFSVFCLFCCLIMRNHNMYSGVVAVTLYLYQMVTQKLLRTREGK